MFRLYSSCQPSGRAIFPFESGGFGFKGINNMLDDVHNRQVRRHRDSHGVSRSSLGRSHVEMRDQAVILFIDVPGVGSEDLKVKVLPDSSLEVSAKRYWADKKDESGEDKNQEEKTEVESRNFEEYRQVFALSDDVNRDEIDAQCRDGVLKVVLPFVSKKSEEQAREIKIQEITS